MNNTATVQAQDVKEEQYNNASVIYQGGNQYLVKLGEDSQIVDLDGYTIMSDEDYEKLEALDLIHDTMWCPSMWDVTGDNDYFFRAALDHAANYSGFDVEQYISENS